MLAAREGCFGDRHGAPALTLGGRTLPTKSKIAGGHGGLSPPTDPILQCSGTDSVHSRGEDWQSLGYK